MNSENFNNLIDGNNLSKIMFAPIDPDAQLEAKTDEQMREFVKIHQVEMPDVLKNKIRVFVKKLTEQNKAPRYIRRAVMREFNINVV